MNPVSPKWLEILKASGWQTGALAIAFGVFIILVDKKIIPAESSLWITIPSLGLLVCVSLSLASLFDAVFKAWKPVARIDRWRTVRRETKMVREFIPHMTERDRSIIGYLLHHNEKMFQHEVDGGFAAPLISKGIIRLAVLAGHGYEQRWIPFEIPDHIWTVLVANKEAFPYTPEYNGNVETHPWSINWAAK